MTRSPCKRVFFLLAKSEAPLNGAEAAFDAVDIDENSWNQLEEYIFKWYPVLQKSKLTYSYG